MKPFQTLAHIHSLDGAMDEITVLEEVGNNDYIVDYKGVKCHALFNWFNSEGMLFLKYRDDYGRYFQHCYLYYTLREALQKFRKDYNLRRKHIRIYKLY